MRRTLSLLAVAVLALAFGASAALADGSQTIAPEVMLEAVEGKIEKPMNKE